MRRIDSIQVGDRVRAAAGFDSWYATGWADATGIAAAAAGGAIPRIRMASCSLRLAVAGRAVPTRLSVVGCSVTSLDWFRSRPQSVRRAGSTARQAHGEDHRPAQPPRD